MAQSSFLENENPVDFLYLDKQRVCSLIGQLSERGMLVGLKSTVGKTQAKVATGGANIGVAKAEGSTSGTSSESEEETYDPFWTHAYGFLQDLEKNFAVPIQKGRIGSLVRFQSVIQFLDLRLMRNLWEPGLKAFLHAQQQPAPSSAPPGSRRKRREQRAASPESATNMSMRLGVEIVKEMPHPFYMTFLSEGGFRLWAAVPPTNLTISTGDLTMKYGAVIQGLWTVVGIVDAGIGEPPEPLPVNETLNGIITAMGVIRDQFGRPRDHFGLTPIAIYSRLAGAIETEVLAESEQRQLPPGSSGQ